MTGRQTDGTLRCARCNSRPIFMRWRRENKDWICRDGCNPVARPKNERDWQAT